MTLRHLFAPVTLVLALLALAMLARPADASPLSVADDTATSQSLFVELIVNGRSAETIVPLRLVGDHMLVEARHLRSAGISLADQGPVDLARLKGVRAQYDAGLQTLKVDAAPDMLPVWHVPFETRTRLPTVADYGAMLNYDAYVQRSGGSTTASLWTEQRIFGPFGTFSNDGTVKLASGRNKSGKTYLRYDTRIRHIDEDRALAVTVGDFITRSLPWNSSVRLGGVQIARDFRVRPDLVTMPLPSFAGKTAVPSAVDLFVDGFHRQSTEMAPGRFVLDNVPVVNGAGNATIVTVDAVGRQISTTIPFYVSSELLRPGLSDFSAEAGFLRRNYGLRNFDYGKAAASGTARYGFSQDVTIEARGELTQHHTLFGAGLLWAPWTIGTFNVSLSGNQTRSQTGSRWAAGYSYTSRRFSIAFDHEERSPDFRDIGSFDLRQFAGLRRTDRAIATVNLARQGNIGIAYFAGRPLSGKQTRLISASYSRSIGGSASLFLSADYDIRDKKASAQLRLVLPFGRNMVTGGSSYDRQRGVLSQIDYDRTIPSDGGLGVDASLALDDDGKGYGQGTLTWRGRAVELQAGGAFADGRSSAWAGATGSLVLMGGDVYAARRISDSFAVVSTNGVAKVPVSYENQPVGVTDRKGRLFVPNVTSFLNTRFAIDTLSLPEDYQATVVEQNAALRQGAGAIIRMPIERVRSATVTLIDPLGVPLPPGSSVARGAGEPAIVGWDGIAYLEGLAAENDLIVTRADGSACHAKVSLAADAPPLAQLGRISCL
jgi:outer membrane usher protein